VIWSWKENILEIVEEDNAVWVQSWKENIFEIEIGKERVASLSSFTRRKSRIDSIKSRDLSKVSHVYQLN
jgi:transcriptional regulator of nitric oxide reductase